MEKRLREKVSNHLIEFKNSIKFKLDGEEYRVVDKQGEDYTSEFLQFIFDYSDIELLKEDFLKRKRNKNIVPDYERCNSLRANGEQCTRRRKEDSKYCGTHQKGQPHGVISACDESDITITKLEIWCEEINGIEYYIDKFNNVYLHEDIIKNVTPPRKIGKWATSEDGFNIEFIQ